MPKIIKSTNELILRLGRIYYALIKKKSFESKGETLLQV